MPLAAPLSPGAPAPACTSTARAAAPPVHRRPLRQTFLRLATAGAALVIAACTTLPGPPLLRDETSCHAWTSQLDAAVAAAGVADAEAERIEGFPGLRVDRVGQALREPARGGEAALAAWLTRAAALERMARAAEIRNLPEATFPLGAAADRAQALARADDCRARALPQLLASGPSTEALREALLERAAVPERYSTASRALGLYPLLRWPFFAGVQAWQNAHLAEMERWATAPPPLRRFVPQRGAAAAPPAWPPAADALGLPQPTQAEAQQLLAWHAPAFEVEVRGAFDQFGTPTWAGAGADLRPSVDASRAVVYQRIAHMRFAGRWRLQLVYTLWFPERPPRSGLDLLAGALDGVIVRLTLGDNGQPILMDTIHACGCYHLFFPSAALQARAGAPTNEEWMFAPAALPALTTSQRLAVRFASATHYVKGVGALAREAAAGPSPDDTLDYELREEHSLRSLPLPASTGRRSLYGPDGLVAGTERGERLLFWPMGIASAGAMRQWGHHATAFVGRRHFDDPDLLEQRFELVPR